VVKILMVGVIMSKSLQFAASMFAMLVAYPSLSHAEQVRVMLDRTQLITMSVQPATVVIGNPAIADANISGNQVFINGYSPGTTNIIMLDASGASLANLEVVVTRASTETAAVFKKGGRQSLVCPDYCDPTVEIGDLDETFQAVSSQAQAKRAAALGIIGQNKDSGNSSGSNGGGNGNNGSGNNAGGGEGSGTPQ
jgi:Flp pilus assembly secretin CpaC